jgi:antitoxin ParD1/3/4
LPTRNIVLTDRQAELVERLVASGRYQNASEVLREGLRLVEHRDAEDKARLKALREAARVGIADVEAGRFLSFDSPASLEDHLTSLTDAAISGKRPPSSRE